MKRLKISAAGLAVIAGAVAALTIWGSGRSSVAFADMKQAISGMDVVHITGESFVVKGNNIDIPLCVHKDKWIRRKPFAVYEENTPIKSKAPEAQQYIFRGNTDHTWWYFPERGNRAVISKGLNSDFMKEVLDTSTSSGEEPKYTTSGHSKINNREVILMDRQSGQYRIELAVDAETKLTLRMRQFTNIPEGKETKLAELKFEYNQTPPVGIFDWQPPTGADIRDKR